jgi:hypothetical protein
MAVSPVNGLGAEIGGLKVEVGSPRFKVGDVDVESPNETGDETASSPIFSIAKGDMKKIYTLHPGLVSKGDVFITKAATRLSDGWPCVVHIVNARAMGDAAAADVPSFVAEHMGIPTPVAIIESPDRVYVVEATPIENSDDVATTATSAAAPATPQAVVEVSPTL